MRVVKNKSMSDNNEDISMPDELDEETITKEVNCCCRKRDKIDEQTRLGAFPPLPTLLKQATGPICSQVVTALYGIVNSFWVSRSIGPHGLTAMGTVSIVEAINMAFGHYLSACISSRISYLFGQKRNNECAQVFVDIIRLSLIFSICVPVVILSITKPLVRWFGADQEIQDMALIYMIPMSGLTIFYQNYMICCGLLQAEGLSWLYGVFQICSLIVNMAALDPLFLLGFKTPIWGASLASIIASTIPMIILMTLIFRGKFDVKPTFSMFKNKFSKESFSALKVGLTTLIELLSSNLPDIVIQKYLGLTANSIGKYNEIISVWSVLLRIYGFIICVCNGIAVGLLPCASFAFGAQRLRRVRNLALHALWIGIVWGALCEAIIIPNAREFAKLWLNEEEFLYWAKRILQSCLYGVVLAMFRFVSATTFQAIKKVFAATIQSVLTLLVPIPIFSTIMYYTDKHNPSRLVLAFPISEAFSVVVCLIFIAVKLRFLFNPPVTDSGVIDNNEKNLEDIEEEDKKDVVVAIDELPENEENVMNEEHEDESNEVVIDIVNEI